MFERMVYILEMEAWFLGVGAPGIALALAVVGFLVGFLIWLLQGRRCGSICRNLHDKPGKVWGSLRYMYVQYLLIGVMGFFMWLPVVLLNVLFAAKLLEALIPGGDVIVPPWAPDSGQYRSMAMNAAILLAAAESFLAALFGAISAAARESPQNAPRSGFDIRIWLFILIAMTVVFEFGLALYRAWLMSIEAEPGLPTMWEDIFRKGGITVAGSLGFIIPVLQEIMAYCVTHWLIIPWMIATIAGFLWAMVGWHPDLPDAVVNVKRESREILKDAKRLNGRVNALNNKAAGLDRPPSNSDVDGKIEELEKDIADTVDKWNTKISALRTQLKGAATPVDYKGIDATNYKRTVLNDHDGLSKRIKKLRSLIKSLHEWCMKWNRFYNQVSNARIYYDGLSKRYKDCQARVNDIKALLGWGGTGAAPATPNLTAVERAQLINLVLNALGGNMSAQRVLTNANAEIKRVENVLVNVGGILTAVDNLLKLLGAKFTAPVPVPAKADVNTWLGKVRGLETFLKIETTNALKALDNIRRGCRRGIPLLEWLKGLLRKLLPSWLLPQGVSNPKAEGSEGSDGAEGSEGSHVEGGGQA
jgi:hypothetical protein